MENRFRFAKAKSRFDCFDCSEQINVAMQFSFDNLRNVRICEPCFYKLSKIVKDKPLKDDYSPVNAGSSMITPVSKENCQQCHREARKRRLKLEADTIEGWKERIHSIQEINECIACWSECDSIAWDEHERQQIGFAYIQHLADLQSIKWWEKPYKPNRFKAVMQAYDCKDEKYIEPPF